MSLPKINFCLFCEGVRIEQGGKATILGFLGVMPYLDLTIEAGDDESPGTGATLMVLVATQGGTGTMMAQPRLLNPDGSILKDGKEVKIKFKESTPKHSFAFTFQSIMFQSTGEHTFQLLLDGTEQYRSTFNVRKGDSLLPGK